uniref:Uncharacterized protein n=1 Tax=Oryza brachyantha TaxID=4533 RepID=J3M7G0_ORYBR
MAGSGESKDRPANFSRVVAGIVVMAALPVCSRGFSWMSQRLEGEARLEDASAGLLLLLVRLLLGLEEEEEDDDDDDDALLLLGLVVLSLSQRSHASPRQILLPRWTTHRSVGSGDVVAPPAPDLCVSHLSATSARPGLGAWDGDAKDVGRMTRHGVGSRGSILLLGGVGSRAGRAEAVSTNCSGRAISLVEDYQTSETRRTHFSPRTLGREEAGGEESCEVIEDQTNWWTAPWRRRRRWIFIATGWEVVKLDWDYGGWNDRRCSFFWSSCLVREGGPIANWRTWSCGREAIWKLSLAHG